ncbi:MAG: hypothetical protein HW400_80 [Candidatus Levybacteria bacterium]|nr:hypothetical protein [Candidatus Levybacteria bacterium]
MVTIYTITYNEELLIQFMIDHYRERFPGCKIVVYDNISTDNTVEIALANSCEVVPYNTNNRLQDYRYTEIKNSCWKDAKTDWVLMCDLDELLDISTRLLKTEEASGTSMIKTRNYDMVALDDRLDIAGIKYGERSKGMGKSCLFNKKLISEINYDNGCHFCNPVGKVVYSRRAYKLYHYCYPNYGLTVRRYKLYRSRISPEEIKNGCSLYDETPEEVRALYTEARRKAVKAR